MTELKACGRLRLVRDMKGHQLRRSCHLGRKTCLKFQEGRAGDQEVTSARACAVLGGRLVFRVKVNCYFAE